MSDGVRIEVPAAQGHGRMAEIAAAHAGEHQGFSPEAAGNLSSAIKEAVMLLVDPTQPDGTLAFEFQGKGGVVTVEARLEHARADPIPHDRIDRFESAAGSLVDSWKLDPDERWLWLEKSA